MNHRLRAWVRSYQSALTLISGLGASSSLRQSGLTEGEKRRIFVTLKVPVLAGPALWRGPEDETQACNGRQVEIGCSRAVTNEPVKDVFEDESEQQCSVQKRGQTSLDVNMSASS
jgi:hypothetical protein